MIRALVCGAAIALVHGCATRPACDPSQAARIAMDEGIVRDGLLQRFPACEPQTDALRRAYDEALAERCVPQQAWQAAHAGDQPDALCRAEAGRAWTEASRLGAQLAGFEQRKAALEADIRRLERAGTDDADGISEIRKLRIDAQRMTREIEQIRGIALIRGWIEQDRR